MILVTLGTQDKEFSRLLEAIQKQIECGVIQEEVVVQAGCTKFESKEMKIFDLISGEEFEQLMEKCDLLITHGGVGSIISGLKHHKKIIAAPRLSKYKEHTNDHQLQIIEEFSKEGYLLPLFDFSKLGKVIEKAKHFKPKEFKSNTRHVVNMIEDYIEGLG